MSAFKALRVRPCPSARGDVRQLWEASPPHGQQWRGANRRAGCVLAAAAAAAAAAVAAEAQSSSKSMRGGRRAAAAGDAECDRHGRMCVGGCLIPLDVQCHHLYALRRASSWLGLCPKSFESLAHPWAMHACDSVHRCGRCIWCSTGSWQHWRQCQHCRQHCPAPSPPPPAHLRRHQSPLVCESAVVTACEATRCRTPGRPA